MNSSTKVEQEAAYLILEEKHPVPLEVIKGLVECGENPEDIAKEIGRGARDSSILPKICYCAAEHIIEKRK